MSVLYSYFQDDSGVTAIEYGLIALLIAIAIVGAVGSIGTKLIPVFTKISSSI